VVVWELEGFGWRWGHPAAGILDMQVRPDLRRNGLGKLLLSHALRFLQDQFFAVAELQFPAGDEAGLGLCRGLGFEQVDRGLVYRRPADLPPADGATSPARP
jgi:ribosomal protein S18 acetylase RimI-like enzyme